MAHYPSQFDTVVTTGEGPSVQTLFFLSSHIYLIYEYPKSLESNVVLQVSVSSSKQLMLPHVFKPLQTGGAVSTAKT